MLSMTGSAMFKDKTTENSNVNDGQSKPKQADPTSRKTQPIDTELPDRPAATGRMPLFRG
jgi:hypothetical protein